MRHQDEKRCRQGRQVRLRWGATAMIAVGAPVQISRPAFACDRTGTVLRRGAVVEEAPGQLLNLFRFPVHGMPVYISIPEGCSLGIGQVLTVEFPRAVL